MKTLTTEYKTPTLTAGIVEDAVKAATSESFDEYGQPVDYCIARPPTIRLLG